MARTKEIKTICGKWKDGEFRRRLGPTMFILIGYIGMGFIQAQRGSAFLDIQLLTGSTLEKASYFFTAGAMGGVVGAVIFGGLYDKFNKNLILFIVLLGLSVTVSVIPYCTVYAAMVVAWFCNTICLGGWDATASAEVVRIWNLESQTYLFLVNSGYSVGAIMGPLATEPFLVPKVMITNTTVPANSINKLSENTSDSTQFNETGLIYNSSCGNYTQNLKLNIQLHYAYAISAVIALVTSLPLLYLFYKNYHRTAVKNSTTDYSKVQELPIHHFAAAICIVMATYICISGIEDAFASFLMTFVVKQLNWSKTTGAQLSAVFFGAYSLVRASCIFIADLVGPRLFLLSSMTGVVLCGVGITLCSVYHSSIGVWIFIGLSGAFIGIIFPIGISWINKTVVSVTGRVSSFVVVGSAIGKLCNPIILGYFMEEFSPLSFCYIIIFEASFCILVCLISTVYSQKVLSKIRKRTIDIQITVDQKSDEYTMESNHEEQG
ncbi:hypothetical protein LOTGIDRAFT_170885 [Lottia gigantea]|uniref:Major facilitator superfamily (MFS) profile domain-containing protein n=1 Tax=Lottia gigantea TaxID=225164 RepID=V4CPD8_LOTGI|nr:hypothetical protein LOTGIDRAFT_170885 [Lottia gigantea]ESP04295.1 hypothetical protein LOTGIDRAFT_170885 [Lottia gigantea]